MIYPNGKKMCKVCRNELDIVLFNISNKLRGYRDSRCKECFNQMRREYIVNTRILPDSVIDSFWSQVDQTMDSWFWDGLCNENGYGRFNIGYKTILAHRFSALLIYPDLTPKTKILHKCDKPPCVRESHFKYGTQAENIADMVSKNRQAKGESHSQNKLCNADVFIIRNQLNQGMSASKIARDFHVHFNTIRDIFLGKTWTHI